MPSSPGMPPRPVRAMLLAVQVFDDVDLELTDSALVLPGGLRIAWPLVADAVGDRRAAVAEDRWWVARWLEAAAFVHARPAELLAEHVRPVGLPRDHVLHPGDGWVQERVLGGALDLGVGLVLDTDVVVVDPAAWAAAGVDASAYWPRCRRLLEEMGALAATRWSLSTDKLLRPMGDCDVLTLLGSASLRAELAGTDSGMRAVVAPMRRRGWTRLSRLDPAFGPAAAMASEPADRGFVRPLLVTAHEVVHAGDGGRVDIVLRDPVVERWDATFVQH